MMVSVGDVSDEESSLSYVLEDTLSSSIQSQSSSTIKSRSWFGPVLRYTN
jgi:hypothetical protein